MEKVNRIEIIWDRDHGAENEGWYIRRHYVGGFADENLGDESGYDLSDSDGDLIDGFLAADDVCDIPVIVVKR